MEPTSFHLGNHRFGGGGPMKSLLPPLTGSRPVHRVCAGRNGSVAIAARKATYLLRTVQVRHSAHRTRGRCTDRGTRLLEQRASWVHEWESLTQNLDRQIDEIRSKKA